MKNEIKICVDMDGVLCDFVTGVADLFGVNTKDLEIRDQLKETWGLEKPFDITDDDMWIVIDDSGLKFWSDLDLFSWAKPLMEILSSHSSQICLLTSPSDNISCIKGKIDWAKRYFPDIPVIPTSEKYFCAHNRSILIDDKESNIEAFKENGGNAFLFPNQWKLKDGEECIYDAYDSIRDILKEMK